VTGAEFWKHLTWEQVTFALGFGFLILVVIIVWTLEAFWMARK